MKKYTVSNDKKTSFFKRFSLARWHARRQAKKTGKLQIISHIIL